MIEKEIIDGHTIVTISNDNLSISINLTRGNIISSIVCNNKELIFLREPNYHSTDRPTCGAPILFPYSGNNENDILTIDGVNYSTGIHGIVHTNQWELTEMCENTVCMKTSSNDESKKAYPYDFELNAKISVNDNSVSYELKAKNLSDCTMPCDFGLHPFFKISNLKNCSFAVNGNNQMLDSDTITSTGCFLKKINTLSFEDKVSGMMIDFKNKKSFQNILVWSGDPEQFLVIEPLTAQPNAINEKKNHFSLKPNEEESVCLEMQFKA
ncbi:MAG: hypothetical protein R3Y57_02260 [Erysipelotrichaceae bacterium]